MSHHLDHVISWKCMDNKYLTAASTEGNFEKLVVLQYTLKSQSIKVYLIEYP